MKQMLRYIIFMVAFCLCLSYVRAEVESRIEGLGENEEYVLLLHKRDSVAKVESATSEELKTNIELYKRGGDNASEYRKKVVEIEQTLMDLRVEKNAIASKINTIEQQWSMEHVQNIKSFSSTTSNPYSSEDVVRIAKSNYAKSTLSDMDIKNLYAAELADKRVEAMANAYVANYYTLAAIGVECDNASSQSSVDSLITCYNSLDSLNRVVARNISQEWSGVVDDKNFAYAMITEKLGDTSIFDTDEKLKIEAARMIDSLQSQTANEELLNYYAGRLSLVELEYVVASALKLPRAVDSLRVVRDSLRIVEFDFPPVGISSRVFIDYEAIKFSTKAIYNGSNPIPYGKIYDQGVIYRLLVGTFKSRQAATLFRGAYPIYIIKNDAGLLSYYLGGYKTKAEAEEAREILLKKGFKRPEVVEWRDGVAPNHTPKNAPSGATYRVEIRDLTELSNDIRDVIKSQSGGRELSKVGTSTFVVGVFDDYKSAEHLMESLKEVDSNISVSVIRLK